MQQGFKQLVAWFRSMFGGKRIPKPWRHVPFVCRRCGRRFVAHIKYGGAKKPCPRCGEIRRVKCCTP